MTSSPAGLSVGTGTTGSANFASGASVTLSLTNGLDAIWSGSCSSGGAKQKTCRLTLLHHLNVKIDAVERPGDQPLDSILNGLGTLAQSL